MNQRPVRAVAFFGLLIVPAWFMYGRILELNPFSVDDLRGLYWSDTVPVARAALGDPVGFPGWRPLPDFVQWLYYQWFQLGHLHAQYVINLLLWTGCAWLVGQIVYRLTQASAPALLAAAVVLVDSRAVVTVIVQEHASSLACFFGLLALLLVVGAENRGLTPLRWMGLSLCLLASGLSKEYGLAFMGAVAVSALYERRGDTATAALAAGATYALLRIAFVGGGLSGAPFCEGVGYFFTSRTMCYDGVRAEVVKQVAYNVTATGLGSLLPGVFSGIGQIVIAPGWLAASVVWLAAVALGCWKAPSTGRLVLLVVAFTAALSFLLYRDRDQVVALCALGIAAGIGLAIANAAARTSSQPRLVRATAAAVLLMLLGARAVATRGIVSSEVADVRLVDPCEALAGTWPSDPAFIKRVKTAYGMSNPDCVAGR